MYGKGSQFWQFRIGSDEICKKQPQKLHIIPINKLETIIITNCCLLSLLAPDQIFIDSLYRNYNEFLKQLSKKRITFILCAKQTKIAKYINDDYNGYVCSTAGEHKNLCDFYNPGKYNEVVIVPKLIFLVIFLFIFFKNDGLGIR